MSNRDCREFRCGIFGFGGGIISVKRHHKLQAPFWSSSSWGSYLNFGKAFKAKSR